MLSKITRCLLVSAISVGFSIPAVMAMAPVVDVDQNSAATQTEDTQSESTGGWQSMQDTSDGSVSTVNPAQRSTSQTNEAPLARDDSAATMQTASSVNYGGGSTDQRVARLEQQVTNLTQMNLPQQVADLHQMVSQLQGQFEVMQQNLKTLKEQQNRYYQDLSQQLSEIKQNKSTATNGEIVSTNNDAASLAPETALAPASMNTSGSSNISDAESYGKAFRLLSAKKYDLAKTEFSNYLKNYPKGGFIANAHYWLGEIAMQKNNYDEAFTQFQTVVSQYTQSDKVADAKLKVAMIHAATGKTAIAKIEFKQIKAAYPGSTAAQLANIQLQQLSAN